MRKKDFWKKLLVFSLVILFGSSLMTSCAPPVLISDDDPDVIAEEEVLDEEVEMEDVEDEYIEDGIKFKRINPRGDKYEVIFDSEEDNIAALVEGTILGVYQFGECAITISKPILPEEIMAGLEFHNYKYVMVTQVGGELREEDHANGGYALLIFFPETLEIRAHEHHNLESAGDGGSVANFEYVPNSKNGEGWERIMYIGGYGNTHDPVDLSDHFGELEQIIDKLEMYNQ